MIWITSSALFILSFQTISSAMTSYTAITLPFVNDAGNYIAYSSFLLVDYIINDGSRINQWDGIRIVSTYNGKSLSKIHILETTICLLF
jgi:hypothetical protein